jgi:hypothetical protein
MDLFDRHLMDGRFGLGEALEQLPGAVPSLAAQRGLVDQPEDFREAPVRMVMVALLVVVAVIMVMAVVVVVIMIMTVTGRVLGNWRGRVLSN